VALNLKFTPPPNKDDTEGTRNYLNRFVGYVKGYFDDLQGKEDGGMEIQFNVTTHDTFVDAFNHPEKYPELLVRVSGYTAYFKDLNRRMQKEIIDRTEYQLLSGQAVPYDPFLLPKAYS
jgi:formate C-acetyltransferase